MINESNITESKTALLFKSMRHTAILLAELYMYAYS